MFLRRSVPVLSSEYFSQAHQILPLELGSVLDRWQYFAITKNGSNTIIIAKYDTLDKLVSVHTILFEKGLLNLAVFHGYVNPSSKVKFFAAAGEILLNLFKNVSGEKMISLFEKPIELPWISDFCWMNEKFVAYCDNFGVCK